MRVAFVASEAFPFAKVGGLADVVGSLPQALKRLGLEVTIFLPWYWGIEGYYVGEVWFSFAGQREKAGLGHVEHRGVRYVLVGLGDFARERPYGYPDDFRRFVRFALATAELVRGFEIVHAHDWQAALLPLLRNLGWFQGRTVYTIHNLAYQGVWNSHEFYAWTGLPGETYYGAGLEHHGSINLMKAGIVNADAVTTVSPRYAWEITTPEGGEGLDGVLRAHQGKLRGILNGLDTEYWNPAADPYLKHPYDADNFAGKALNRKELLAELGLEDRPTLGLVSRFAYQKGIDLVVEAVDGLMDLGVNLAVLGSGDAGLERTFSWLAERLKGRLAYVQGYHEALAHRIYAGSDGFLMPSRFEPCGLAQLIAMRYGTPPIVRAVGGLLDTVQHWETGFMFDTPDVGGVLHGVREFLKHPDRESVAKKAMRKDFSWDGPARAYLALYRELAG
ncbi:MAG: glycogen synthase [Meiothermus sp.]|uniref:glycogen synthase n=1 Tax=Meiothermus sp. TaxID=1955249 RepID=UPI0025ED74B8|nr:glycogen synthase [Meiothermus sp.]MCS7194604.1 glycogen synthase [Meiothermus sp.]MCX7740793.1 glycogen synthase [Meiothermus sp.]MDW8091973.1 glycogen synthase [Meiothermus sp.]MDW8481888.1 glycogen synthase [Meiothermus sp.]